MSAPGPHVFLLVIKLGVRFTEEERNSVKWIQENFGKEALLRTIILFTHTDLLRGKSLEAYIRESCYLPKIVDSCGGRYHSFNNEDRNNQQVTELLLKISGIMKEHGMKHYTPDMFKTTKTDLTRKDKMNLTKVSYILCAIILIGGILIETWHVKQELQKQKEENQQLTNELKQKEEELQNQKEENQQLKKDLKQKEEQLQKQKENQQLTKDLKQEEQLQKEENQQLKKDLKQKEEQLQKQKENQQLTKDLKQEEQLQKEENQQLTNELKQED